VIGPLEIGGLLLVLLAAWLVWDTLRSREHANAAMRNACERHGLYFLDDTVSLQSLRPVRDEDGRIKLRRIYRFQYSDTGHNRRNGSITLVTNTVTDLELDHQPQQTS
jgi:ABC-type nickel/cobalt efflux system permease component RcnA